MAIDSVRLLTDSAAQLWRRLETHGPLPAQMGHDGFDAWLAAPSRDALNQAEEQALRREFRRLSTMIDEIGTLLRSHERAVELVISRAAEPPTPLSYPAPRPQQP